MHIKYCAEDIKLYYITGLLYNVSTTFVVSNLRSIKYANFSTFFMLYGHDFFGVFDIAIF